VKIHRNVPGVEAYDSLENLFYVLNSSLEYIVLRNFESYPEKYNSSEHGDIDLLVNDLRLIRYLTGAKKVFKRKNRVHYKIKIQDRDVYFDFRHIGDAYYDKNWEIQLLRNRILKDELFYVPEKTDYYYSLLYHAILHKPFLTKSYQTRLSKGSSKSSNDLFQDLDKYMRDKMFMYVIPKDISVYYNYKLVSQNRKLRMNIVRRIRQSTIDFRLVLARLYRSK